jgi:hypothetical protein
MVVPGFVCGWINVCDFFGSAFHKTIVGVQKGVIIGGWVPLMCRVG